MKITYYYPLFTTTGDKTSLPFMCTAREVFIVLTVITEYGFSYQTGITFIDPNFFYNNRDFQAISNSSDLFKLC